LVALPTPWDVIRIVKATGLRPKKFLEFVTEDEVDEVDDDDPTWLKVKGTKYIMALKRDEETGCFFLDNKTRYCKIYESRPILCRLYPLAVQEDAEGNFQGFTLHKDVSCPRHKDGVVDTKPLHDLYKEECEHQDDYEALVKVFNKKKYKGKKAKDFIEMFVSEV
jgi:Fe-S-cluster containining protein